MVIYSSHCVRKKNDIPFINNLNINVFFSLDKGKGILLRFEEI